MRIGATKVTRNTTIAAITINAITQIITVPIVPPFPYFNNNMSLVNIKSVGFYD